MPQNGLVGTERAVVGVSIPDPGREFPPVVFVLVLTACRPAPPELRDIPPGISRIAFGSCAHQARPQPIWDAVLVAEPEVFILLGDNVYADTAGMGLLREVYESQGANTGWQRLFASTEVLATWGDHDFGLNDGGADFGAKEASRTPRSGSRFVTSTAVRRCPRSCV
jgi:alkaline phosphatase D